MRPVRTSCGKPGQTGSMMRSPDLLTPAQYLAIHEETGLSMRAIWGQTQRWAQYGHLNGPDDADAVQTGTHE